MSAPEAVVLCVFMVSFFGVMGWLAWLVAK